VAYFYSLRGWLQISHEDLDKVTTVLTNVQASFRQDEESYLYMKCWCWITEEVNWLHYVFYGLDVKESGLALFESVLDRLAKLGCGIDGYFHAQGEDGTKNFAYIMLYDAWSRAADEPLLDSSNNR